MVSANNTESSARVPQANGGTGQRAVPATAAALVSRAGGPAHEASVRVVQNFKSEGSEDAPVTVEVYLDYDCVHCADFVREVLPPLMEEYVRTGKIRLLFRDFPMPNHRFANLAARYADAAGALGYYDAAMKQLFRTREAWSETGDIDMEVAQVLPPDVMTRLRDSLKTDTKLAEGIGADRAAGQGDRLDRTPFAVIVYEGKRQAIADAPLSFEVLKSRIDGLPRQ